MPVGASGAGALATSSAEAKTFTGGKAIVFSPSSVGTTRATLHSPAFGKVSMGS